MVTPLTGGGLTADLIRLHNHSTAVNVHARVHARLIVLLIGHSPQLCVVQVAFVGMPSKHFDIARRSNGCPDAMHAQALMTKVVAFTDTQCPVVLCVPGSQASIVTTAL